MAARDMRDAPAWLVQRMADDVWETLRLQRWETFTDEEVRVLFDALVKESLKIPGREAVVLNALGIALGEVMDDRGLSR